MGEVISFQRKKVEIFRDAVEEADAHVGKRAAEADWLRRCGASLAELVRASLNVDQAMLDRRKCEEALDRLCGRELAAGTHLVCE
jgi:hypothetical protein